MPRDEHPTNRQLRAPVVLVVGGTPGVAAVVQEAAIAAQVPMTRCALAGVTTVAAEIRPLVMVMSEEIFGFDPESFRALARDVHSRLLTVQEGQLDVGRLECQLKALMLEGPSPAEAQGQPVTQDGVCGFARPVQVGKTEPSA